jgi:quercetin dioxygenase-like cupin family protein
MMFRIAISAVVLILAANFALAQDPTKVEPRHYHLDFENEHVQVVAVHYGPHERSAMHEHPGGVVVVITGGHLKFTDERGKITEVFAKPGEARWFAPFKHRVENVGDTAYNAVYVGIKGQKEVVSWKEPAPLDAGTARVLMGSLSTADSKQK